MIIEGPLGVLAFDIADDQAPAEDWRRYAVPLRPSANWAYTGPLAGDTLESQFAAVLADVGAVRIRASSSSLLSTARLDTVSLPPPTTVVGERVKVVPALANTGSRVGSSVDIAGGVIAVGNFGNADAGVFSQGVYMFDAATGGPRLTLLPDARSPAPGFGFSVGLLGNDALVGAPVLTRVDAVTDDAASDWRFGESSAVDAGQPVVGVLDLADIDAFVAAYTAGDPLADVDDPFGVLDLEDIDVFITSFLGGCP